MRIHSFYKMFFVYSYKVLKLSKHFEHIERKDERVYCKTFIVLDNERLEPVVTW